MSALTKSPASGAAGRKPLQPSTQTPGVVVNWKAAFVDDDKHDRFEAAGPKCIIFVLSAWKDDDDTDWRAGGQEGPELNPCGSDLLAGPEPASTTGFSRKASR